MSIKLIIETEIKTYTVDVLTSSLIFGRSRSHCSIVLDDKRISSSHLELKLEHNKLYLRDLKSTNGTFLNEQKINEKQLIEMNLSDVIRIGNTFIRIDESALNQQERAQLLTSNYTQAPKRPREENKIENIKRYRELSAITKLEEFKFKLNWLTEK